MATGSHFYSSVVIEVNLSSLFNVLGVLIPICSDLTGGSKFDGKDQFKLLSFFKLIDLHLIWRDASAAADKDVFDEEESQAIKLSGDILYSNY